METETEKKNEKMGRGKGKGGMMVWRTDGRDVTALG